MYKSTGGSERKQACAMYLRMDANAGVPSSDSTPFADKGIPAVSFAGYSPFHTAMIHNRYDTWKVVSPISLLRTQAELGIAIFYNQQD